MLLLIFDCNCANRTNFHLLPGEEVGLRGVGGGGLEGLGGRVGFPASEGDPLLFSVVLVLGEDLCSTPSTDGELSRLGLSGNKMVAEVG